jgi:hypothetical protein
MNIPNSIGQTFCVEALLVIDPLLGPASSPRFDAWSLCAELVWSTLVYDPIAVDPDGDSLSFDLTVPLGLDCVPIVGYMMPSNSPEGWHWLDPGTGVFHWHQPPLWGEFVIAIRSSKWRNGVLVGQVTRDMVITVMPAALGIHEGVDMHGLAVRPTLGDGHLWIDNTAVRPVQLFIVDASGRIVHSFTAQAGEHPQALRHLGPGTYVLRSTEGHSSRFVIQ